MIGKRPSNHFGRLNLHVASPIDLETMATDGAVLDVLSWGYETAVRGGMGISSAIELSDRVRTKTGTLHDRANSLIRWQATHSAAYGLIGGLCGGPAAVVALPAASVLATLVRLRMIAAIAHLGDHDIMTDEVRVFAYACLCGNG